MSLTLKYKGVDITSNVSIQHCVHDMYAEEHGDTVVIKFSNSEKLWDKWKPKAGDELEVESGNAKTGKMYVKSTEPMTGYYTIRASSLPASTEVEESESWEKITKLQLAKDFANKHGMTLRTYGVTDRRFEFLRQSSQKDMEFFENLCVLEGDAFLIYDGDMILYNEEKMEQKTPTGTIVVAGNNKFHYEEQMLYSGCKIKNGSKSCTYLQDTSYGYVAEKTVPIYIGSEAEAERYAKGMLRYLNKKKKAGYFYSSPIAQEFAAGSIVRLKNDAAGSYDGTGFIYHIRHDYTNGKSKIFFRVPMEG